MGKSNNLIDLIAADPAFHMSLEDLKKSMDPAKYTGRAKEQTEEYIEQVIRPVLSENRELLGVKAEVTV